MGLRRVARAGRQVVAGALLGACLFGDVASAATPQELTVVSPDRVSLTSKGDLKATIVLLNAGAEAMVAFRVDADKAINVKPAKVLVKGNEVARVQVTFAPADSGTTKASGELIATAGGRPPSAVAFDLAPAAKSADWALVVIFAPLIGAVLLVGLAFLSLTGDQPDLGARLGPVNWDFSTSFAGNATVFSAVLGTILAAGVLPKTLPAERVVTYAALNLLFGVAVIAGPFLYTALQRPKLVHLNGPTKEPQYLGYVWTFLIAAVVTVWATAGEFATIATLFSDMRSANSLPEAGLIAFEALIAGAAVALLVLIWTRSKAILSAEVESTALTAAVRTKMYSQLVEKGVVGLPDVHSDEFVPGLEAWTAF